MIMGHYPSQVSLPSDSDPSENSEATIYDLFYDFLRFNVSLVKLINVNVIRNETISIPTT